MVDFVELPIEGSETLMVNPERVAYVKKSGDFSTIVFEGFNSGLHAHKIPLDRELTVAHLKGNGAAAKLLAKRQKDKEAAEAARAAAAAEAEKASETGTAGG